LSRKGASLNHWPYGLPNPGFKSSSDLAGLTADKVAGLTMTKIKSSRRVPQKPLEAGQVWRMAQGNLQVGMVGKLLVHYKLGKQDAVRVANSCNAIKTIEKYLKTNKAVLV
jgi:hypothetical protein